MALPAHGNFLLFQEFFLFFPSLSTRDYCQLEFFVNWHPLIRYPQALIMARECNESQWDWNETIAALVFFYYTVDLGYVLCNICSSWFLFMFRCGYLHKRHKHHISIWSRLTHLLPASFILSVTADGMPILLYESLRENVLVSLKPGGTSNFSLKSKQIMHFIK